MRWYEYKMETDDLYAPDDLKAKLLAMTDQLTEEEKAQPMMKTAAPVPAQSAPVQPKKKLIRFPAKRVGALAACLAVCVVGYGAFATGQIGLGAKSSSPAAWTVMVGLFFLFVGASVIFSAVYLDRLPHDFEDF